MIITIVALLGRESVDPAEWLASEFAGNAIWRAMAGWTIASVGPVGASVTIWMLAEQSRTPWIAHLLFLPLAAALFKVGSCLFFSATGQAGESLPGDYALLMGVVLFVVAVLSHLMGCLASINASVRRKHEIRRRGQQR